MIQIKWRNHVDLELAFSGFYITRRLYLILGWSLGPYLSQLSSAVHRAPLEVEMKERQRERERESCFKKEKNILASPGELAHTPTPGTD